MSNSKIGSIVPNTILPQICFRPVGKKRNGELKIEKIGTGTDRNRGEDGIISILAAYDKSLDSWPRWYHLEKTSYNNKCIIHNGDLWIYGTFFDFYGTKLVSYVLKILNFGSIANSSTYIPIWKFGLVSSPLGQTSHAELVAWEKFQIV